MSNDKKLRDDIRFILTSEGTVDQDIDLLIERVHARDVKRDAYVIGTHEDSAEDESPNSRNIRLRRNALRDEQHQRANKWNTKS